MISKKEFYVGLAVVIAILIYIAWPIDSTKSDVEIAKLQTRDSILTAQNDSLKSAVLVLSIKGDSLQSVINTKNLQLKEIKVKYVKVKDNVSKLSPDSTVLYFLSAIKR